MHQAAQPNSGVVTMGGSLAPDNTPGAGSGNQNEGNNWIASYGIPDYNDPFDLLQPPYNIPGLDKESEDIRMLAAIIYAEADGSPFRNSSTEDPTEEMLAIGSVVRNRTELTKENGSFCSKNGSYADVIKCGVGGGQFLSYNSTKYNTFIGNSFGNKAEFNAAKASLAAAKKVINSTRSPYSQYHGFNQSKTISPFSKSRTDGESTKIGAHYFWKMK